MDRIARCGAALESDDAIKKVQQCANDEAKGWRVSPLPRDFDHRDIYRFGSHSCPRVYHVLGRQADGKVERTHALTIYQDKIFDANYPYALKLSKEALDACIPGRGSTFERIIRGFEMVPSKRAFAPGLPRAWSKSISRTVRTCRFALPDGRAHARVRVH